MRSGRSESTKKLIYWNQINAIIIAVYYLNATKPYIFAGLI